MIIDFLFKLAMFLIKKVIFYKVKVVKILVRIYLFKNLQDMLVMLLEKIHLDFLTEFGLGSIIILGQYKNLWMMGIGIILPLK